MPTNSADEVQQTQLTCSLVGPQQRGEGES